jgi:hypothetical protein
MSPFLTAVQARAARISVSASATRKQGGGIIEPARAFFTKLDLSRFAVSEESEFHQTLNEATESLRCLFPNPAESWGISRKLTNIFIRDALYTSFLRDEFGLAASESLMEVPLDSISAGRIFKGAKSGELPKWPGVKRNDAEINRAYQAVAERISVDARVARVHLDTWWWGDRSAPGEV